jgi:transcriptional regulator with XRE-family HTH domain
MGLKVIQGTPKLAEAIKNRRQELGLTIEEAAFRADIGIKTWCRYEAGESIRHDKAKGICKTLNWHALPSESDDSDTVFDLAEYKAHRAWSNFICSQFGEAAAVSFVIGSDIVMDYLNQDLDELSRMPKGTHVGQLPISMTKDILPVQFLMKYDYESLYHLKVETKQLIEIARYNDHFLAHSVIQEMLIYLFMEESQFLMDCMAPEMEALGISGLDARNDWAFDLFEDMDIVTCLYSDDYLTPDHIYHFDHWAEYQFHI